MNICSTCQGAQSECQERLDANTEYREHVNRNLSDEGLRYEKGLTNKNFLWLLVEELGLDELRSLVKRRSRTYASARSTAVTSCARSTVWISMTSTLATATCTGHRRPRRHRDRLRRRLQMLRIPDHDDEQAGLADHGRAPPRRCDRRRGRLPRRSLPLCHLNLDLQQPAAEKVAAASSGCRCCTSPSSSGWRSD